MRPAISRILIADDHQAMRQGVRSLLESHPAYQVIAEAGDGREALDLAREGKPDIAILDYSLPLMNGLELTRSIKHDLPRTEVLIYTMHDRESILIDVLRAGARGYVLKSDSGAHLIAAVAALARHKPYFSGAISETLLEHFIESDHSTDKSVMLTAREREIVQLIAEGKLNKQIAHMLNISVKTVETHRAAAMHKLKLRSTAELVLYAVRNNIVEP
ncbi:response regulator transcription factor [Novosphingobium sp. AP12]|jgi:DNA-binding NarL/FixJ family response regulator|uniref:response regulator n=1 Tax=Novosphingobium sp. AP12 TaxID=1144305 RepID=UPI000272060E|nr:response regulator transcription factor [Novosphingobium sp. AP12]EJL22607.1 response regulator containing a CheY-like receiver domain and an HTH DNA-binding domain [Novosphingobium sp. AP12]